MLYSPSPVQDKKRENILPYIGYSGSRDFEAVKMKMKIGRMLLCHFPSSGAYESAVRSFVGLMLIIIQYWGFKFHT